VNHINERRFGSKERSFIFPEDLVGVWPICNDANDFDDTLALRHPAMHKGSSHLPKFGAFAQKIGDF